jgi:DNA-binding MarR family transcriptional regulator
MSKRIDRLESMGLVSRVADEADQRALNIVLTRDGVKIADAAIARIAAGLAKLRKAMGMSQAEIREMDGYLRRLSLPDMD